MHYVENNNDWSCNYNKENKKYRNDNNNSNYDTNHDIFIFEIVGAKNKILGFF